MRYYEDLDVGETHDLGSHTVTAEEIVAFAERYDPQPFHVDEDAAAESMFGGLVASGWHTAAVCMRLLVDGYLREQASEGASGLDELRWHAPVRPGDTIAATAEILDKRVSESNPAIGHTRMSLEGENQGGERVISWVARGMVGRRPE